MQAWTFTEWAIVGLAFLAGLFIGLVFCTGRKWKRRYHDEVRLREEEMRRREELERERAHWEAKTLADRARER